MSSDMNLFDLFNDSFLKGEIKDDLFVDDNYGDIAAVEESPTETEDLIASIFKMEEDSQLGFNLMDKDLETIQSSSSDSGLSSALSLSYEQQLSPFLSKGNEEEHIEISNSNLSSPQNFMDFEPAASPSLASVDSPVRSVVSSNIGSPATDATEEMDYEQTLVAVVTPNNTTPNGNTVVAEQPIVDISPAHKQTTTYVIPRENAVRNVTGNGKRNIRQFVRVTPVGSGNPRSILLPISLKDMKEVRTIKLMTATQARNLKNLKMNQANIINKQPIQMTIKTEETNIDKSNNSSDEIVSETDSPYPRLKLNAEEKRLLQKEGITLPSHYPLTKHEERELKRIRRKIRNKISAQDSRKRKKEYVDGLEDRVKQCTQENMTLLNQIEALQTQNKSLTNQLKRLQTLLQKGNKSAQPATCLVVLLLSLVLVALPNGLQPHSNNNSDLTQEQEPEQASLAGRSRTLLHTKQLIDEELQQYGEELLQEVGGLLDHDYSPVVQMPLYKRPRLDNEAPSKYVSSMNHVGGTLGLKPNVAVSKTKGQYIDPPLDDVWPPPNPGGQKTTRVVDKLEALTNELKINISDVEGTRTVFVKMPHDK